MHLRKLLVAAVCGICLLATSTAYAAKDIVDTAAGAEDFSTLVAAVKAAGLVETLKGDGPFTVFAPTNAAFAKLPEGTLESLLKPENKDKLVSILTYHVVPGKVLAEDVVKLNSAKTVQGQKVQIDVKQGTVMVNDAKVVKTDIEASNGVIHVIDSVLLPPQKTASTNPRKMIAQVVAKGSHLYNTGHVAECSQLYMQSLQSLHSDYAKKMSPQIQQRVQHTLQQAKHVGNHDARAWMLRHTLDKVYRSMQPLE